MLDILSNAFIRAFHHNAITAAAFPIAEGGEDQFDASLLVMRIQTAKISMRCFDARL